MTKIQTEATTTALVVERPTPCVPPVVLHAVEAAHQRNDDREQKRFQQTLRQIVIFEARQAVLQYCDVVMFSMP